MGLVWVHLVLVMEAHRSIATPLSIRSGLSTPIDSPKFSYLSINISQEVVDFFLS